LAYWTRQSNKEVHHEAQADHLRHARFLALRDDKEAREVTREIPATASA
jgi:hypothetical protein